MSYYAGLHEVLDSRTIGLIKLWTFGLIIILRTLRDTHYNTILQREPICQDPLAIARLVAQPVVLINF